MASWWTISVPAERRSIDLNADIGEAGDDAGFALERALLGLVTSAHIACGGHAGGDGSMRAIVQAALDAGVRVGAHPSYPDRAGFGRRPMEMALSDLASSLDEQISALMDVAASLGAEVCSVKPHGALYGEVGRNASTFDARPACSSHCVTRAPPWCSPPARLRSPGPGGPASPCSRKGSPIVPIRRTAR